MLRGALFDQGRHADAEGSWSWTSTHLYQITRSADQFRKPLRASSTNPYRRKQRSSSLPDRKISAASTGSTVPEEASVVCNAIGERRARERRMRGKMLGKW